MEFSTAKKLTEQGNVSIKSGSGKTVEKIITNVSALGAKNG